MSPKNFQKFYFYLPSNLDLLFSISMSVNVYVSSLTVLDIFSLNNGNMRLEGETDEFRGTDDFDRPNKSIVLI